MNAARLAAVKSLVSIQKNQRYANLELDSKLRDSNLNERDRALFTTLVYGVIERQISLNHLISRFCKRTPSAISPFLRATLQCAFYQLEFLDNIPARAVLFESAEIAKIAEKHTGAGLVSAVLHAYLREKESGTDLYQTADETMSRSLSYSLPLWMINLWDHAYGKNTSDSIARALTHKPATTLFINTLRTTTKDFITVLRSNGIEAVESTEDANIVILLQACGDIRKLPGFDEGLFFVQDPSCVRAVRALDLRETQTVADVCAAPGGKSFACAIFLNNTGSVTSFDLHQNRVGLILKGAERLGIKNLSASCRDARNVLPQQYETFDRVLCDVPCSGLGVISKKPDLRLKTEDEISSLPQIQSDILSSSAKLLKRGGKLLYSTCTLNPKENEEVVEAFLKTHTDFSLTPEGMRNIFPVAGVCDGFFYAVLEKHSL